MKNWHIEPSDKALVIETVTTSGTSFYWGMRLLPKPRRLAMYGLYAFCRTVDNIADSLAPCEERLGELALWRQRIEHLYDNRPDHGVTRFLHTPVARYNLAKEDFLAIIDGVEMDARETMRWPGLEELELYCQRVAGAVGLLSTRIFGEATTPARRHAIALGHALQLTNILRDVHQDAQRDRLYLPREDLYACGVEDAPPGEVLSHPGLARVCARVATRARDHFDEAHRLYNQCDRHKLRPAYIMRRIYVDILDRLEQRGWDRLDQAVSIPAWRKTWLVLLAAWN